MPSVGSKPVTSLRKLDFGVQRCPPIPPTGISNINPDDRKFKLSWAVDESNLRMSKKSTNDVLTHFTTTAIIYHRVEESKPPPTVLGDCVSNHQKLKLYLTMECIIKFNIWRNRTSDIRASNRMLPSSEVYRARFNGHRDSKPDLRDRRTS